MRNIEQRVNYISELLVGAFYIHARPEQKALKELEGKKVSLSTKGSSATTTGPIVFEAHGGAAGHRLHQQHRCAREDEDGRDRRHRLDGRQAERPVRQTEARTRIPFLSIDYAQNSPTTPSLPPVPRRLSAADPGGTNDRTLCTQAVLAVDNFPKGSDRARRVGRIRALQLQRGIIHAVGTWVAHGGDPDLRSCKGNWRR